MGQPGRHIVEGMAKGVDEMALPRALKKSGETLRETAAELLPPMRVELLKTACRGLNNVRVIAHGGLLIDCAHEVGAKAVIRGLRPLGDFESEYQMAQVNKRLGGVETLLMTTSDDCASISSSIVRQVAAFGGDISPMVPEGTAQQILAALSQK